MNSKPLSINHKRLTIPQHIAIIMDGNRRWARAQGLPSVAGHRKVANEVLEPLIEHAADLGIRYMTFWAFSTENWSRPRPEVKGIMNIFRRSLKVFGEKMHKKGMKILTIGDINRFDRDIKETIEHLVNLTAHNTRITCIFALNYGGRDEIVRAINKWSENSQFTIHNSKLTDEDFSKLLDTQGIPDPDLIIRTGGEMRLSGFLPWQSQYSELYFPSFFMPEFTPKRLDETLVEFQRRQRRFGK